MPPKQAKEETKLSPLKSKFHPNDLRRSVVNRVMIFLGAAHRGNAKSN